MMSGAPASVLPADDYPSPTRAWWMVAVFFAAAFMSYVHRLILGVLIVPMQADLGFGDARLSLLQGAAFAVVYVFAGLPFGWLADRRARRNLILAGATVWSIGTLSCGFAPSFAMLFAARVLVGIGEAALAPAAASMIADAFPSHRRGTALGVFLIGTVIGGPAAVGIGGALLAAARAGDFAGWPIVGGLVPWRAVLTLVGACGLVIPLLVLTVREPVRKETTGSVSLTTVIARVKRDRSLLAAILLGVALLSVGDYGLYTWTPATLERGFAWSSAQIGAYFSAITAVTGIVGALLGGLVSDAAAIRFGQSARFGVALFGAALGIVAALLIASSSAGYVLTGVGLWTLASSIGAISGIAALQAVMPNEMRGIGMSFVAFCNTLLGLGCGPTIVALVTEYGYGSPAAVGRSIATVVAPAAALSVVLFLVARRAANPPTA